MRLTSPAALRLSARFAVALLVSAAACGGGSGGGSAPPDDTPASLTAPGEVTVQQDSFLPLVTTVRNADGGVLTGVALTYEVEDPGMIGVGAGGILTALGPAGQTTVRIRPTSVATGVEAEVGVTVAPRVGQVTISAVGPDQFPQLDSIRVAVAVFDRHGDPLPTVTPVVRELNNVILLVRPGEWVVSKGPAGTTRVLASASGRADTLELRVQQVLDTLRGVEWAGLTPNESVQLLPTAWDIIGAQAFVRIQGQVGDPGVASWDETTNDLVGLSVGSTSLVFRAQGGAGPEVSLSVPVHVWPREEMEPVQWLGPQGQGLGNVVGLAVGPDGTLFLGSLYGALGRLAPGDAAATLIPLQASPAGSITDLAVAPDGTSLFVPNFGAPIARVDLGDSSFAALADTAIGPIGSLALSADGGVLVGAGHRGVFRLDPVSLAVEASHPVSWGAEDVVLTPSGDRAYAALPTHNSVLELDPSTLAVLRSIPVLAPRALEMSPDGSRLYVSAADGLSAFDLSSLSRVNRLPGSPGRPIASADGTWLYLGREERVLRIDAATFAVDRQYSPPYAAIQPLAIGTDGSVWAGVIVGAYGLATVPQ